MLPIVLLLISAAHAATWSGYVNVNKAFDANLFYYFIESSSNPAKDPVVLWLQGGPGCSSLFGAFIENGPQIIQSDGTFKKNPYSWTTNANVIWIDSPVGTGFSYVTKGPYASDEKTIAQDLYIALNQILFNVFPQYNRSDFYIFGESYAGKYVPWLAHTILTEPSNKINLKAIGIGDGWTQPYYQTGSYAPFLYRHGLINELELELAAGVYDTYKGLIDLSAYTLASIVGNSLLESLMLEAGVGDPYDITKPSDPTDPLSDLLTTYLNDPKTRKQLHVGDREWVACATGPNFALSSDEARSAEFLIPKILAKIPVLLYNGDNDLICNMDGTATWASLIDWPYQQQFNNARNQTWMVGSTVAGSWKTYSTLTLLVVHGAGHMVPYDQPVSAHDMLYRFIAGGFKP